MAHSWTSWLLFVYAHIIFKHVASQKINTAEWAVLNRTVGGRLHVASPVEAPCFTIVNGKNVSSDPAACAVVQGSYVNPDFRADRYSMFVHSQWETCQKTGAGCLLDDTNPENTLAFEGKDCDIGNIPSYYIDVQSATDIQAAYVFSLTTGVRLSVKSRGHDYKGRSGGKGTLGVWVAHLNSISFNGRFVPENCHSGSYATITIGPGAEFQDIYAFADQHNVTFIGGYASTVGSGFYLGGGHSVLSPNFGLGVDRVVQLKVVTPDGHYRTVNECQDSDLFWALRGGGGSAFGVVTELSLSVEPQMTLQAAIIKFIPNATNEAAWYELAVENSLQWGQEGWGGHITATGLIHVTPKLNDTAAEASMRAAIDFAVAQGGSGFIDELSSWYEFFIKYVIAAETPPGPEAMIGSRLIPTALFETQEGRNSLTNAINNNLAFAKPYIIVGTPFLLPYVEGTTSVTPAWRNSLWHLVLNGRFYFNSTLDDRRSEYEQVSQHMQDFRDISPDSGSYFNEGDVYEPDYEQSYWGSNYEQLLEIKHKYDPLHLLDCWHCVGWKGADDPQYSCYVQL